MKNVWLIGTGLIGMEYSKVLDALHIQHLIIGRGEISAAKFEETRPGKKVIRGGLDIFLKTNPSIPDYAIVAVGLPDLYPVACSLINYGIKKIFLEKPGGDSFEQIEQLYLTSKRENVSIFIAYNRRFYSSVLKAEEIIKKDGGITSFSFEFTEWLHIFDNLNHKLSLEEIFIGNSTHVLDTAFFLGGEPVQIHCHSKTLEGDMSPKIFVGAGISNQGALFSYQANWDAPGRWVIEILTKKHRLYFKPMETLQIQELRSVKVLPVDIDDHLDKEFKPGFFLETKAFLNEDYSRLCSIEQHVNHINNIYKKVFFSN
ncbi:MAG: gfo/Idh/MocA family oxidoreductase [Bacteroidales bacterium]|nr:gfo/Idh/MocA family oxidoreductase [Bacteroidales bacterium]